MPLAREYRRFYLDGVPFATSAYWDVVDASDSPPPTDLLADVARGIPSRFFTLDFARAVSGEWLIVETGDGQVAGLPERMNMQEFYRTLVGWLALG